jgi:hypothetical protein
MRRLPIGAGVRLYGALAKVVRAPASQKPPRGFTAVVFDGVEGMRLVRSGRLEYVAARYETAKSWEQSTKSCVDQEAIGRPGHEENYNV